MGAVKKDLEIVYDLQWKNLSSANGDDRANIVGMYDVPTTTLHWEIFKSYLLKNSGATGDDVKVSYIGADDREFVIDSQIDFQIALYSFRQRARNGEIITLKLDHISEPPRGGRTKRVRKAFEMKNFARDEIPASDVSQDGPPDWFKKYMTGFKKEIVEEVTAAVSNSISNLKMQGNAYNTIHHSRKPKAEPKRIRKLPLVNYPDVPINDKDLLKSLKMEHKVDLKLEKLEHKTQKLKEKKLAFVRSSDSDVGSKSRPIGLPLSDTECQMNALPTGQQQPTPTHMNGGEIYEQVWEIINCGKLPMTDATQLRYAWGSEALKPINKTVPCPELNPGQTGTVTAYLEIPRKEGLYECYWHFYHKDQRFGHWLGTQIIVDPSPNKTCATSPVKTPFPTETEFTTVAPVPSPWESTPKKIKSNDYATLPTNIEMANISQDANANVTNKLLNTTETQESNVDNISILTRSFGDLGLVVRKPNINYVNSSSDSDNQSIISLAESSSSICSGVIEEFVVIPPCFDIQPKIPEPENSETSIINLVIESQQGGGVPEVEDCSTDGEIVDIIKGDSVTEARVGEGVDSLQSVPKPTSEYLTVTHAYVTINGEKYEVPKKVLRDDFVTGTENVTNSEESALKSEYNHSSTVVVNIGSSSECLPTTNTQSINTAPTADVSCSISSAPDSSRCNSMSSSRLFIFPLDCPGFEVVQPDTTTNENPSQTRETTVPYVPMHERVKQVQYNPTNQAYRADIPHFSYGNTSGSTFCGYAPSTTNVHGPVGWGTPKDHNCVGFGYPPHSHTCWNYGYNFGHERRIRPNTHCNSNQTVGSNLDHSTPGGFHYKYVRFPSNDNTSRICSPALSTSMNCSYPNLSHEGCIDITAPTQPVKACIVVHGHNSPNSHSLVAPEARNIIFNEPVSLIDQGSNTTVQKSTPGFTEMPIYPMYETTNRPMQVLPDTRNMIFNEPVMSSVDQGSNRAVQKNTPGFIDMPIINPPYETTNAPMQVLPDTLVSGAVNVASSAINTARSVLNMFAASPKKDEVNNEPVGTPQNETPRARGLRILREMGFYDHTLNVNLLILYNDDLLPVISELLN